MNDTNQTMLDSSFGKEVIETIKTFHTDDEVQKLVSRLIDTHYLESIGFYNDNHNLSAEETESFVENCIDIAEYLFENQLSDKETIAEFFCNADDYIGHIDTRNSSSEEDRLDALLDKILIVVEKIIKTDSTYWKLLRIIYERVAKPTFSKVASITLDNEPLSSFEELQSRINGDILHELAWGGKLEIGYTPNVILMLENDLIPGDTIKLDLRYMYDMDFITSSFVDNMLMHLKYVERWEIEDMVKECEYRDYAIELEHYGGEKYELIDFDFLLDDVKYDVADLLKGKSVSIIETLKVIDQKRVADFLMDWLLRSYRNDLQKINHEIRFEWCEKDDNKREVYICTSDLENELPEFQSNDADLFVIYLKLKYNCITHYYHYNDAMKMQLLNLVNEKDINRQRFEGLGILDSLKSYYW